MQTIIYKISDIGTSAPQARELTRQVQFGFGCFEFCLTSHVEDLEFSAGPLVSGVSGQILSTTFQSTTQMNADRSSAAKVQLFHIDRSLKGKKKRSTQKGQVFELR